MSLVDALRKQGWGILSDPLAWWLSGGQETGFSTNQISLLAAVLGTAGIAGVSAVAIADRLSRYNITIEEYQDKPRKEWYEKIPKKAIKLALALGIIGGTLGLSMVAKGRVKEHIEVDVTEFEFDWGEGERPEYIPLPAGGGWGGVTAVAPAPAGTNGTAPTGGDAPPISGKPPLIA